MNQLLLFFGKLKKVSEYSSGFEWKIFSGSGFRVMKVSRPDGKVMIACDLESSFNKESQCPICLILLME